MQKYEAYQDPIIIIYIKKNVSGNVLVQHLHLSFPVYFLRCQTNVLGAIMNNSGIYAVVRT